MPQQTEAWHEKLAPLEADWAKSVPDGAKILEAYRAGLQQLEAEK